MIPIIWKVYLSSGTAYTTIFLLSECNVLNRGSGAELTWIHIELCYTYILWRGTPFFLGNIGSLQTRSFSSQLGSAESSLRGFLPLCHSFAPAVHVELPVCTHGSIWCHLSSFWWPSVSPESQLRPFQPQLETCGPEQWLIHEIPDSLPTFNFSNTP